MFIDAHTHLTDKAFDFDRKEVIERSGCVALVNNGYTISDNRATLVLAKEFPPVKVALGLHPSETAVLSQKEVDTEIEWIAKQKCVAIGEIGLDFTYDEPEKQIVSFQKLIALALKKDIPMIIHSRKAEKEVLDVLEEMKAKKVILHCFSGKVKLIERAEKLGYTFSIPPIVNHSQHFQDLVKKVSITKLLTETDAPFLSPKKGERNEPAYVQISVKKIAEIKGMDAKEVEHSIFANYQRLFY
ncbi:MAG: TatD DNase family protein [archaeon GW2011_AR17]|nr:MAG: TatD DNase family protein [archaeon GW2011_AR17]MBS3153816.1 TatD family hydrolase [Candidatus Woesearchaeota archaeon]HIH15158.1 TatD family hydrolase [Nanoarchaeota archaeon]HIH59424.1 TatD family hydrolase [Nanoarchaeota archaeon]HII13822.1 TatD family hydrolase [Nanoarchaeota archaeon]